MGKHSAIEIMYPSAPPETIPIREKLLVARDIANSRMGRWEEWPRDFHMAHAIIATWSGRAVYSPWPIEDLEKVTDAARHLLAGTRLLAKLGEQYGD